MSQLEKARALLKSLDAQALLITSFANRFYYSGFHGTAGYLLITQDSAQLITDSRYTVQSAIQAADFEIVCASEADFTPLSRLSQRENLSRIAYEDTQMSVYTFSTLQNSLPNAVFIPAGDDITLQRRIKNNDEVKKISSALSLADNAFSYVCERIHEGIAECEVAADIEDYMRRNGAEKPSFDTICASGIYSAMPHHTASKKPLCRGDFLVMDYGCILDGYCSDITRTVVIGKADEQQLKIYDTVLRAQQAAEKFIACGKSAADVDNVARRLIADAGFDGKFSHSLGHGVGIEIHEAPTLSPRSTSPLSAGDIVTIEPGIYIENLGGVRIEDMVYIKEDSIDILTTSERTLIEIS